MSKLPYLIVALSVFGSAIAPSDVANGLPQEPDYFCYERAVSGQVVNLTTMCKKVETPATKTTPLSAGSSTAKAANSEQDAKGKEASAKNVEITAQAKKRKMEFSDYTYDGRTLLGTVKNGTGKPVSNISVVYEVKVRKGESNWDVVDNGSIDTNNRALDKRGKTNFKASPRREGDKIFITDIEYN